ncbi:hypothetical protein HanRHA438_Chr01g0028651 [Helianthus annuus]|nr:hypothetical protein HanRHA438_Chr01g0028651 [Helianthus annuus]
MAPKARGYGVCPHPVEEPRRPSNRAPPPPGPVLNVEILPFATNQLWWAPSQM